MSNSPKKIRNRTCTGCGHKGPPDDFSGMTRVCHECNRARVEKSEGRASERMDIPDTPAVSMDLSNAFDSREALSDALKVNLQRAINDANTLVAFQKARLQVARDKGDSKLINEASKALENAQAQHIQLSTKLMEKLQAMEDLRAKEEKAKPVVFYVVHAPDKPNLIPVRVVPPELLPVVVDEPDH